MRILVMSDLHLDYRSGWTLPADLPDHDVVVLAGDVHKSVVDAVQWADAVLTCPVVLVAGNHDFWGGKLDQRCFDGAMAAMGTRVHFLARNSVIIDGVRFVGATLWTDFALSGDPKWAMHYAWSGMNDYRRIRNNGGYFTPTHALAQHRSDLDFIVSTLADTHDSRPSVVVTHHAPHPQSLDSAADSLNPAYASDLTRIMTTHRPALWVHGHIHSSRDYLVGDTRVVCNPKGYGHDDPKRWMKPENRDFTMKVVDVVTGNS